jgi:hypothetical protein
MSILSDGERIHDVYARSPSCCIVGGAPAGAAPSAFGPPKRDALVARTRAAAGLRRDCLYLYPRPSLAQSGPVTGSPVDDREEGA